MSHCLAPVVVLEDLWLIVAAFNIKWKGRMILVNQSNGNTAFFYTSGTEVIAIAVLETTAYSSWEEPRTKHSLKWYDLIFRSINPVLSTKESQRAYCICLHKSQRGASTESEMNQWENKQLEVLKQVCFVVYLFWFVAISFWLWSQGTKYSAQNRTWVSSMQSEHLFLCTISPAFLIKFFNTLISISRHASILGDKHCKL